MHRLGCVNPDKRATGIPISAAGFTTRGQPSPQQRAAGGGAPMPSHDPARKRAGFSVRRRVRVGRSAARAAAEREMHDSAMLGLEDEVPPARSHRAIGKKLREMAPLLWATDYNELRAAEVVALTDLGVCEAALNAKAAAPLSSYRKRGKTRDKEKQLGLMVTQSADMAAMAMRQSNQQCYPFTICARSVSKLTHMTRHKDWADDVLARAVLDKKTTNKLVHLMMECKPPPESEPMRGFSLFVYDQCYKKKGKSRGQHRAAEKVDASGDLVDLVSMVIVNTLSIHVPCLLAGGLTPQKRMQLQQTGPYTKPFVASLLPALHPDRVNASLYTLMEETGTWVTQVMARSGTQLCSGLNVALVARALVGRPNVHGGRTPIAVHQPLLNCDTKARKDTIRISTNLEELAGADDVIGAMSDGQSMLEMARLKKEDPARWKMLLIICGCFHQFGHFLFAGQEGYFECITKREFTRASPSSISQTETVVCVVSFNSQPCRFHTVVAQDKDSQTHSEF